MEKITIGALADIDAGKTTLAEGILYKCGMLRKKGRVDHKDSFLDFEKIEREKGITLFCKEAFFKYKDQDFIYIDTPGHIDFVYEQKRSLKILDYAIMVVSCLEQNLTNTKRIYDELKNNEIKTFIFINKMDIAKESKDVIVKRLKKEISANILSNDELLDLLNEKLISDVDSSMKKHEIVPYIAGSALKDENIDLLLDMLKTYTKTYKNEDKLNAYIYRYNDDDLAIVKILSGHLNSKMYFDKDNKINEMYEINGSNYIPILHAFKGDIVAIKGLKYDAGTYIPSLEKEKGSNIINNKVIISRLSNYDLYNKIKKLNKQLPELNIKLIDDKVSINLATPLMEEIILKLIKEKYKIDIAISSYIKEEDIETNEEPIEETKTSLPYTYAKQKISNEELDQVFNNTYKQKIRTYTKKETKIDEKKKIIYKKIIYIIDGYNLMHALDDYKDENFQILRDKVIDMVCDFKGYTSSECVLVFDAYNQFEKRARILIHDNISIVYTKNKQTADEYIEVKTKELVSDYKVIVVTSDYLEQIRIFASGATRLSSREFIERYKLFKKEKKIIQRPNQPLKDLRKLLELDDSDSPNDSRINLRGD